MDGDKRFFPTIEVGKDGGLKNAVVAVVDVEDKAFTDGYKGTEVIAEFCEFLPYSAWWSTPRISMWKTTTPILTIPSPSRGCSTILTASP